MFRFGATGLRPLCSVCRARSWLHAFWPEPWLLVVRFLVPVGTPRFHLHDKVALTTSSSAPSRGRSSAGVFSDSTRRATSTCRPRGSLPRPLLPPQVASGPVFPSNMGVSLAPSHRRCLGLVQVRTVVLSARFQSARKSGPVEVPGGSSVLVGRAMSVGRSVLGILTTACRRRRPDVVTAWSSFRVAQQPAAAPEAGRSAYFSDRSARE